MICSIKVILLFLFSSSSFCSTAQQGAETGTASFYADKFIGRKCSSGEIFNQNSLTGAHKNLKFGTRVKVTNLKNDSSVIVTINDRMPKNSKRCIDVTKKAAKQLNFLNAGLIKVRVEVLKDSLP
ncbi:MAG: rare lipoprotein [Bacteroidetes bacterium]|nr:rare lipoprotein [Bacteroidota bacterium]